MKLIRAHTSAYMCAFWSSIQDHYTYYSCQQSFKAWDVVYSMK